MKLFAAVVRIAIIATAVAGLALNPARAQTGDPCSVYACMAGLSGVGATGGPGCTASVTAFHAIQVWDPYFDSAATATARREFLMKCPGIQEPTNAAIVSAIIAEWGYAP